MKIMFVCYVLSVLPGNSRVFSPRVGLVNKLFEAHAEIQIRGELNLSERQIADLAQCHADFRAAHREFLGGVMRLNRKDVADGQVPWEVHKKRVRMINREIIRETRAVIGQSSKFRRYVELLTQKYLRECRFEEAAALHRHDLGNEVRKEMQLVAGALSRSRGKRLSEEAWRSLSSVLTVYLEPGRIDDVAGELYEFPEIPRSADRDPLGLYDDRVLRLCLLPPLQRELNLSRQQTQQLAGVDKAWRNERALEELNRQFHENSGGGEPVEIEVAEKKLSQAIELLTQRIDDSVRKVLNPVQQSRLDQVLLQAYVRDHDFAKALMIVGVPKRHFDRLDFGNHDRLNALSRKAYEARMYLRYRRQLDELWSGTQVFDVLVGEGVARRLIGAVVLAPEDPLQQDTEIRNRLTSEFRRELKEQASTSCPRKPE